MLNIRFVNHASVVISDGDVSLLSDPWYWGTAFHDGWSLLCENTEEEIKYVLDTITHIWISHEHPDHFHVPFFKKYSSVLKQKQIKVLFQETKDKRVVGFLESMGLKVEELKHEKEYYLSTTFKIKCVKSSFYDSALLSEVCGKTIFNLNDCNLHEIEEVRKFRGKYGTCHILLTQFSYAAWKGGKENLAWRESAAIEKLNSVLNQSKILSAQYVIPFASFVRFSNSFNAYLNDSVNTPNSLIKFMKREDADLIFFRPMETQDIKDFSQNSDSLGFWMDKFKNISYCPLIEYEKVESVEELKGLYKNYRDRIFKRNNYCMIWLLAKLRVFGAFQKLNILIKDSGVIISFDLVSDDFLIVNEEPHLAMSFQSIKLIFLNDFGFDTLTVNGCFEEIKEGGFSRATKVLAIGNLNNLGIFINPYIILRADIIIIFINLLAKVSKRLKRN